METKPSADPILATYALIESSHPSFEFLKKGNPIIGLVVTIEPFYQANTGLYFELKAEQRIPILQVASADLEELVLLSALDLTECLLDIVGDEDRRYWDIHNSAHKWFSEGPNPFIAQAKRALSVMGANVRD